MWFKKNAEAKVEASVGVEVKTHECDHKWKDFGISTSVTCQGPPVQYISIVKHYACIWCKKEKHVLLAKEYCRNDREVDAKLAAINKLHNTEYLSVITERIADFQLLDREYLEIARRLHPDRGY